MDIDLAAAVMPYVGATVGAHRVDVVARVMDPSLDANADPTVRLGRLLLRRLLVSESTPLLLPALDDLAIAPRGAEPLATLRWLIRKALLAEPDLARDVAVLLTGAPVTLVVQGGRSGSLSHQPADPQIAVVQQ